MTNKSIRDYINLVENAQREGVAEGSESEQAELAKKIRELLAAGKDREANHLRRKLNQLKDLDRIRQKNKQGVAEGFNEQYIYLSPMRGLSEPKFVAKVKGRVTNDILNKLAAKYKVSIEDFEWGDAKWAQQHQGVAEEQLEETSPEAIAKINQITRR